MKNALKCILIAATIFTAAPVTNAQPTEQIKVAIKYNPNIAPKEMYKRARKVAEKACKATGRFTPMRRALERGCVRPILDEFVLQTQRQDLIALHARKTGTPVSLN